MVRPILRTKLCDILGIEYPIILAGMGEITKDSTVATGKLAAAVSNAGGMGIIGGGTLSVKQLCKEIADARALTTKPFGIDLIFPSAQAASTGTMTEITASFPRRNLEFVESLWDRFGIKRAKAPELKILDEELSRNQWGAVLDAKLPYIASALGTPDWLVGEAHDHGMKVVSLVGTAKQARRMAEKGVDFIVAQGAESGGHTGRIGLMSLLPLVVEAVSPIPVIAAGGIATGSQLAAALVMGAAGVWVGTAFEATVESPLPNEIKQRFVNATSEDTSISRIYTGKTVQHLRTPMTTLWEKEGPPSLPLPHQHYLVRDLLFGIEQQGRIDLTLVGTGQGVGMIKEIRSAQQVIDDMIEDAIETLTKKVPANVILQS